MHAGPYALASKSDFFDLTKQKPQTGYDIERNALEIAASNGAIVEVVRLFAVFHDSRRENDGVDFEHGERGAEYAASLRGTLFDLSDTHLELLQYACRWHTHGQLSDDSTIGACWDADRLDLTRIGMTPKAEFMSTALGRTLSSQKYG
jgi:uncharacterized protein